MKKYITTTLLLILTTFILNAQNNASSSKKIISEKNIEQNKTVLTEGEAYKMLYENAKENNNQMLSTLQAIIGI
jgi:hypothetical protein